jgi:tetratricopeptide (TPR) repeat protein
MLAGYYSNKKGTYDVKVCNYTRMNYEETLAYENLYGHPETSYSLAIAAYQSAITNLLSHEPTLYHEGLVSMQKYAKILENRYQASKMEKQGHEMAVASFHMARASHLIDDPHTFDYYGYCVECFRKVARIYATHDNVSVFLDICQCFYDFVEEKNQPAMLQKGRLLAIDNVAWMRQLVEKEESFKSEFSSALLALGKLYVKMKGSDKLSHAIRAFEEVLSYATDEKSKTIRLEAKRSLAFVYMRDPYFDEDVSLKLFMEILNECRNERNYALAQAYENLGIYYSEAVINYKEAYHYHSLEEVLFMEIYEESKDLNDLRNYIISLKQMAQAAYKSKDVNYQKKACALYREACEKSELLYVQHHTSALDMADLYEKYGLSHSRFMTKEHSKKALNAFKMALDYLPREEFTHYLQLEELCGQMCMSLKRYDEALDHYQLYMDVMNHIIKEQTTLSHQNLLANGYHHLGLVKRMLKRVEESSDDFEQELTIRTDIYHQEESEENRYKMACVHRYLGDNLQLLKHDVQALGNYKVLNYHMKALAKEPKARKMLALSEEKIGNIYKRYGDEFHLKQALACYQKVYDLIEPGHDERSLVAILQKIAYVYGRLGKDYYGEAMALYRKQASLLLNLCAVDEKYKDDYASCLNNQGVLLKVSDPIGAIELFEKVVDLRKASTSTPEHLLKLGNTYRLLADLTKQKNYYKQAIHCFEKSQLKAAEPYKRACEQALKEESL